MPVTVWKMQKYSVPDKTGEIFFNANFVVYMAHVKRKRDEFRAVVLSGGDLPPRDVLAMSEDLFIVT